MVPLTAVNQVPYTLHPVSYIMLQQCQLALHNS
jgi:hypothetical protein